MMADKREHVARAQLSILASQHDPVLLRLVREHGAEAVLGALRAAALRESDVSRIIEGQLEKLNQYLERLRNGDDTGVLTSAATSGVRFLSPLQGGWPTQLDDLGDACPLGLWVRGEFDLVRLAWRSIAVVGARACTSYGAYVAGELAAGLAEHQYTVISGAGFGIDAAAHRGTLAVRGVTVAVLPSGLDRPYPSAHRELLDTIASSGVLAGENPPGAWPNRSTFLRRNSIVAALAGATVIVEAAKRSGSLSTARTALLLRRPVLGVPGPVTSGVSQGVHELISEGDAILVTSTADILEQLNRRR